MFFISILLKILFPPSYNYKCGMIVVVVYTPCCQIPKMINFSRWKVQWSSVDWFIRKPQFRRSKQEQFYVTAVSTPLIDLSTDQAIRIVLRAVPTPVISGCHKCHRQFQFKWLMLNSIGHPRSSDLSEMLSSMQIGSRAILIAVNKRKY